MAKRNYPNDYYSWFNDDDRIAILERVTSTASSQTHRETWDSVQSSGDLSGTISSFANYNGTVAGTTKATCSASHDLTTGDRVSITSSPDSYYDGNYAITKVDADEFYFTKTYSAEDSGTWNSLFIDNGLRVTFHSKYEEVNAVTDDLKTGVGLDSGMHHALVYYVKFRLLQDAGDIQQAEYYRKLFQELFSKYPTRKSGVRYLSVPRI